MSRVFFHSLQSEWLKQRRSLASWMVIVGAFFTPAIIVVARLIHRDGLPGLYALEGFWQLLWRSSWESAAIFFLPIGGTLATALITQIEYKNNAWKLVHALPLSLAIVALQYTISVRFRNFLIPVGFGFMLWVGTLAALSWRWNFLIPYSYTMLEYLKEGASDKVAAPAVDIHAMAIGYFLLFTIAGYWLFATRKEKG